jgi:hypothetical protein
MGSAELGSVFASKAVDIANEAMHRMSGTHICLRFEWFWMPLIGDLDRSAATSIRIGC